MEVFSIICLVIVLLAMQHLLNWLWRKASKDEDMVGEVVAISFLLLGVSYGIIHTIILWGKNLI